MLNIGLIKYDMTEKSGGDRVAANLSNELAKYYKVHLISINGKGEKPFYSTNDDVIYAPQLEGHKRIRYTIFKGGRAVRKYVKENNIRILLSIGGNVNTFLYMASFGRRVKTVFCEHLNLVMANKDRSNALLRWLGIRFADKIVTLTSRDRQEYIDHYKIAGDRVTYIYNWMEESLLEEDPVYNDGAKKIITVGSLCQQKGYDMLVRAAKRVFDKHPDWRWDIYGDGADKQKIQADIENCGLQNNLFLMGATSSIYDRYREYALYVLSSYYEGLPMVLLEAKAKRLPIVSFDCLTGPAEIVRDEVDGYLVPAENVEALADSICRLIEDPQRRIEFSLRSRENIDMFERENIVSQWKDLIDNLAEK